MYMATMKPMTKADLKRSLRLLGLIQAGGKGSARFTQSAYETCIGRGWLVYVESEGYKLTDAGAERLRQWG